MLWIMQLQQLPLKQLRKYASVELPGVVYAVEACKN